jgi:membrane protein DedA with SNARE-associated domain
VVGFPGVKLPELVIAHMSDSLPLVQAIVDGTINFIRTHEAWFAPLVLVLAFGESLAFISLLLPATVILFAAGGLIGASGIGFWPIWGATALGAFLGDWVSYGLARHYRHSISHVWLLSKRPELMEKGHAFFEKYGALAIFFGRFSGPLRATVPLVAGMVNMGQICFQIANAASALVWATGILLPGYIGFAGKWCTWLELFGLTACQ